MMQRLVGIALMIAGAALIFAAPRLVLSVWPIRFGWFGFEGHEPTDGALVSRFLMAALIGVIFLFAGLRVFRSARFR